MRLARCSRFPPDLVHESEQGKRLLVLLVVVDLVVPEEGLAMSQHPIPIPRYRSRAFHTLSPSPQK
jgi:hypothetical protein